MSEIALIGKKIGMSREFYKTGQSIPVTILKMETGRIIQVIDKEKRGYQAVQVGFGKIKNSKLTKAMKGYFAKKNTEPKKILKEFKVKNIEDYKEGNEVGLEIFKDVKFVDVRSKTIGKGFAGAMKRHNFGGLRASHGVSVSHRAHGSTGQNQDPGKVFKGKKMAGRLGNVKRTIQNLEVVKTIIEDDLILVKGSVPGPRGLYVTISDAVKIKQDLPYPTSNNLVQEQEKNSGEDSNQNLNSDENTENIENKNNEISQKMNEDMKATSNENAKSVDQDNKTEKQGDSKWK